MLVVYASRTGKVHKFIQMAMNEDPSLQAIKIDEGLVIDEPFILVTYTTGFGQVPEQVQSFLSKHSSLIRGVAASGNRNWGTNFAKSADVISSQFKVPVVLKFELSGSNKDILYFKNYLKQVS